MRRIALAIAAVAALVVPASASAAKKPKPAAWAAKHHLKGAWRAKDADRDGLKNAKEFKLGTNPRKRDSDRDGLRDGDELASGNDPRKRDSDGDGVKDGAEHAGVVTAFDGETLTLRQFHGPKLTATLDASSDCGDEEPVADESDLGDDEGYVEVTDDEEWVDDDEWVADTADAEEDVVDLDDGTAEDDDVSCIEGFDTGAVLRSAEFERDGGELYLVAFELAD